MAKGVRNPTIIDLNGRSFGRLTVKNKHGNASNGAATWLCLCTCGKETVVSGKHLRNGSVLSCGCYRDEINCDRITSRSVIESGINSMFVAYKGQAKNRNIEFCLSVDEFSSLISSNCFYCGSTSTERKVRQVNRFGERFFANGVDRKNSRSGYSVDNCVPCCKLCNMAKQSLDVDSFLELCRKIVSHHAQDNGGL